MNKSKHLFLIILFCLFVQNVNSQTNASNRCGGIKYDTISRYFIAEVDAENNQYIGPGSVMHQGNSFFIDKTKDSGIASIYTSDTVFNNSSNIWAVRYWPCFVRPSLSRFSKILYPINLSRKEERSYNSLCLKDDFGNTYIRFYATLVVINVGEMSWHIPEAFVLEGDKKCEFDNSHHERVKKNSYVVSEMLEMKLLDK